MAGGESSAVKRIYLSVYNWTLFFGWLLVLYRSIALLIDSGYESVYAGVETPLMIFQSAAVLEILHSLTGIVRSPASATVPQILSRLYLTWGILFSFPEIRSSRFVATMVISWSLAEIIRYSYFGAKEAFGSAPPWLHWLRYTAFMILYLTGISSEVALVVKALPFMKLTGKYSISLPNAWNFSFDYHYNALLVLAVYVPFSPRLYGHMLAQRKKALAKPKTH
ncbi:hypothetical protein M569_00608 [Genlisea aurea]|uniref:Very-long-chain (3R)-3-hydroxyacyl-CoA dehydratase n=1 Tax=Genlisea aurea TaxID=192259 RepID=S8D343_9LAMI|nr:hypothetical protein M569_00608 [Genlisea aurea]